MAIGRRHILNAWDEPGMVLSSKDTVVANPTQALLTQGPLLPFRQESL